MDNTIFSEIIYKSLTYGFAEAFKLLWNIDEFKSLIIGIPVSIITFKTVGIMFGFGRRYDIWFGSFGGKIMYYLINSFLVWLVMKIV